MSSDETRSVYDNWYKNNISLIYQNKWDLLSKNIESERVNDTLRGLNLITFLPKDIQNKINDLLLPKLNEVTRNQFIIPKEELHITLFDMLPHNCNMNDVILLKHANSYIPIIEKSLDSVEKIDIEINGIFSSPNGITIQGYPLDNNLGKFRNNMRQLIREKNELNFEEKKYSAETAHISLVKFISTPDSIKLLNITQNLRSIYIGSFTINKALLNISPRYDKGNSLIKIKTFKF